MNNHSSHNTDGLMHRRLFVDPEYVMIVALILVFSAMSLAVIWQVSFGQQFIYLARSFLDGKLYLPTMPNIQFDTVWHNGHYYWPLGPLPAIVLMPFVLIFDWLKIPLSQGHIQIPLALWSFILCYKIAQKIGYNSLNAAYLAFAFGYASVFQIATMMPTSWYLSHVLTVTLLLLSLFEYFTQRRYMIIGILIGLTFMTRATAGLGILFYLADLITDNSLIWKQRAKLAAQLLVPLVIAFIMLGSYNTARFGTPFDNGYHKANNWELTSRSDEYVRREYGLFQLRNIPTNIYYYFLKGPDPVLTSNREVIDADYILKPPYISVGYQGIGFFFVAPIFLFAFRANARNRIVALCLIPITVILAILLTYYWPGEWQVGPRYTLDFLPFAFVVLLFSFPNFKLSPLEKIIIIGSAFFNYFLALLALG